MVRGCQKKIIYLKNTDSEVFDEAYFVLRDERLGTVEECDMVKEANRILGECITHNKKIGKFTNIKRFLKEKVPMLSIGIIIGVVFVLLIK